MEKLNKKELKQLHQMILPYLNINMVLSKSDKDILDKIGFPKSEIQYVEKMFKGE